MDDRKSFYVTLPSNACHDIYPDNNNSSYTVQLSQPIELVGPYEVALAEIMYCATWNNIVSLEDYFVVKHDARPELPPTYCKIPSGNYETIEELVKEMNAILKKLNITVIVYYSPIKKKLLC